MNKYAKILPDLRTVGTIGIIVKFSGESFLSSLQEFEVNDFVVVTRNLIQDFKFEVALTVYSIAKNNNVLLSGNQSNFSAFLEFSLILLNNFFLVLDLHNLCNSFSFNILMSDNFRLLLRKVKSLENSGLSAQKKESLGFFGLRIVKLNIFNGRDFLKLILG